MSTQRFLARLFRDEEGQSTTEYILILAVVVMIAMKFKQQMGTRMGGIVDQLGSKIESEIGNMNP